VRLEIKSFSALVENIYDAALNPALWHAIPEEIATLHQSPQSILFAVRRPGIEGGFYYPHGLPAAALEAWSAGVANDDVWVAGALRKGAFVSGNVVRGEDLVSDEELLASDYYRNFLARHDIRHVLSGVLFDGTSGPMPVSCFSVMRGHADAPFDSASVELHRLVTQHVSRALGTMWRLRARDMEIASTYAALDRLSAAVVLLDARGRVAFCNARATAILEKEDGIALRHSPGVGERLVLSHPDAQAQFDLLVKSTIDGDRAKRTEHFLEGLKVPRSSGAVDFVVQVTPLGRENEFSRRAGEHRALVFITDSDETTRLDEELLSSIYGLTRSEVRLVEALLVGDSLVAVAARLSISENTAKKHLQNVFAKTRTHRQAQLVRLLMALRSER
jgi:DNA-binding CsgD family transcriptional regulator/PAS domain-containing protein